MPLLIAIDPGTHAVKVTTWRTTGRKIELEDRLTYPVPQDGTPPTREARLAAVDALLDDHGGWPSGVTGLALSGGEVSFRRMSMPFADRSQVEQTLPFAIEGEVPFDLEDMVLAWRVIASGLTTEVMTVLCRDELLSGTLAEFKARGLDPAKVYADGELLGEFVHDVPGVVAVVEVGHTRTNVTLVIDGAVHATRSISVGGWTFTRAIQNALDVTWAQAESMKHGQLVDEDVTEPGSGEPTPGPGRSGYAMLPPKARQAMDGAIGQLLAEVRSTMIRFEDTLDVDIEQVRLTGGSARIPELWDYFAHDLGVSVGGLEDEEGNPLPAPFAAAHALGLHLANANEGDAIDIRIGEHEFRGGVNGVRAVLTYGTVGAAFFSLAAILVFVIRFISLTAELADHERRVVDLVTGTFPEVPAGSIQNGSQAVATMTAMTQEAIERSDTLPEAEVTKPPTVEALFALTSSLPPHEQAPVDFSELVFTKQSITFTAEADGYAQSAQVEELLQKTPRFRTATKGTETKKGEKIRFSVSIPLDVEETEDAGEEG